jgi:hypothetical protein
LYADLAKLRSRAGHTAEAQTLLERRREIWRYWDGKLPGNVFVKREMAAL